WGNHSATQFPDFYNAKINGQSAAKVIGDETWLKDVFVSTVQQRGAAVIKARGSSSAASAANAIITGVNHLVRDTVSGESFSMCLRSNGEYGVDEGLIFSFACKREQGELQVVKHLPMNDYAQGLFDATLDELRHERDTVKSLGLLD
ncbi:MAG: malate dehydrogenase, partial [Legionellales bacterium]